MKKILFIAFMLLSTLTYSQKVRVVKSAKMSIWDEETRDWVVKFNRSVSFKLIIYKDRIVVNDEANSVYIVVSSGGDVNRKDYSSSFFNCYDEKGRNCRLSIAYYPFTNKEIIFIFYNDICYDYTLIPE